MTSTDVAAVAAALELLDGAIVDVRPRRGVGHRFPDELPNLGVKTIVPYTECADCATAGGRPVTWRGVTLAGEAVEITSVSIPGTWTTYGTTPLCRSCAWARWRQSWR